MRLIAASGPPGDVALDVDAASGSSVPSLDDRAFLALYREALPSVHAYLRRRCGSDAVAQDLVQETFLAAIPRARRGETMDVAWLIAIARHKLVDHFRREARDTRRRFRLVHVSPRQVAPHDEADARLDASLSALPAMQRAALILRYVDGLDVPEVAVVLGRSVHATESLLARGRDGLRRRYLEAADD